MLLIGIIFNVFIFVIVLYLICFIMFGLIIKMIFGIVSDVLVIFVVKIICCMFGLCG